MNVYAACLICFRWTKMLSQNCFSKLRYYVNCCDSGGSGFVDQCKYCQSEKTWLLVKYELLSVETQNTRATKVVEHRKGPKSFNDVMTVYKSNIEHGQSEIDGDVDGFYIHVCSGTIMLKNLRYGILQGLKKCTDQTIQMGALLSLRLLIEKLICLSCLVWMWKISKYSEIKAITK